MEKNLSAMIQKLLTLTQNEIVNGTVDWAKPVVRINLRALNSMAVQKPITAFKVLRDNIFESGCRLPKRAKTLLEDIESVIGN